MTLKREIYLNTCSENEQRIRSLLKYHKYKLKEAKSVCNSYKIQTKIIKPFGYLLNNGYIMLNKIIISNLRHELNRLKGMDRVARIDWTDINCYGNLCGRCKCGNMVTEFDKYCDECGRRILDKQR